MAELFAELKRRHIHRVGAAYVIVAWALAQGVDLLSQIFQLPPWIAQPAVIVLAIGFPVALIAAIIAAPGRQSQAKSFPTGRQNSGQPFARQ
jgi:hypothetical protein